MRTVIEDPYFDTDRCVTRLVEQYELHKSLLVAFDFDDTIFDFHKKGFEYPKVVELLLRCQKMGFTLIMLTTTESDEQLDMNQDYCEHLGINVRWVNKGPVMPRAVKPFFNAYLDDKAGLAQAHETLTRALDKIDAIKGESK